MYFDAVLDADMRPLFNGTPKETREWLSGLAEPHPSWRVCPGRTMALVTVPDYMSGKVR